MVVLGLIGKVPHINVVGGGAADLHGAGLAEEVESLLQVLGVDIGGALDGAHGAVLELHHGHADVLTLQIVMELLLGDAVDFFHLVAHHPAQQVDAVDALIHQAAAVLGPGAPPGGLVIVAVVPVPADMDGAVRNLAETTGLQGLAHLLNGHIEAVLVAGGHLHTLLLAAADDLLSVVHVHSHGLFDDDIDAVVDAVEGDLGMDAALGGDGRQGYVVFRQHLLIVGVALDGGVVLQVVLSHFLRQNIAHGDDLQLVVDGGLHVVHGNAAAADESVFHNCSTSFYLSFKISLYRARSFFSSTPQLNCCSTARRPFSPI